MAEDALTYAGKYKIKGLLGQGGTAKVYLCIDEDLGREVAIKEPLIDRPGSDVGRIVARFLREARINGVLQHPGIVPVYELGAKPDGTRFYSMRPISGVTLHEAFAACRAETPQQAFRLRMAFLDNLIDIADALAYAHASGIVHRDIKPGNILLGEFGETLIFDWGLAKRVGEVEPVEAYERASPSDADESDTIMTRQGQVLGTPSYMAPEQVDPRLGEIGPASDVYALGVILFILLTGEKPYVGSASQIMELKAQRAPSPSPRDRLEELPVELAAVCEKAMQKDPALRYGDAKEFGAELRAFRDGRMVSVYAYSRTELLWRFAARNKAAIAAAIAVLLAILIATGLSLRFAFNAENSRARVEHALTDITEISDGGSRLVTQAAEKGNIFFSVLSHDLATAAAELASADAVRRAPAVFKALQEKQRDIDLFALVNAKGQVIATFPTDNGALPRDLELLSHGRGSDAERVTAPFLTRDGVRAVAFTVRAGNGDDAPLLAAILHAQDLPLHAFELDPIASPYQVWCMDDEGTIVYDEDPLQIGKRLFSDATYASFPELLTLGERIAKQTEGIGYYRFSARGGMLSVTEKIAAWDTFDPVAGIAWKIVATYPYQY